MLPSESPKDLWSSSPFSSPSPGFPQEARDEIGALFARSKMSSVASPSFSFTERVMARVREQALAQQEVAPVAPVAPAPLPPITLTLSVEGIREYARAVTKTTWVLTAALFLAGWLAVLTSPIFGFGVLTAGVTALIMHAGALHRTLAIITGVLSHPETAVALMCIPIMLFIAFIALMQRYFPRIALTLF